MAFEKGRGKGVEVLSRPSGVLGGGLEVTLGLIWVLNDVHFGGKSPKFGRPGKRERRREREKGREERARGGPRVILGGVGVAGREELGHGQVGDGRATPFRAEVS